MNARFKDIQKIPIKIVTMNNVLPAALYFKFMSLFLTEV